MASSNTPLKGSSLYAGIFGSEDSSSQPNNSNSVTSGDTNGKTTSTSTSTSAPGNSKSAATSTEEAKPPAWSAALRFAPRKSAVQANRPKPRPNAAFIASAAAAAAASTAEETKPASITSLSSTLSSEPVPGQRSKAEPEPGPRTGPRPLPATSALIDPAAAASHKQRLVAAPVLAPPPTTLPPDVLERDRALVRRARANMRLFQDDYDKNDDDDDDAAYAQDEDVNGFLASAAGRKASQKKKKNKRKRGASPPNMDNDYDPRIPNDYATFREQVFRRRQAERDLHASPPPSWRQEQDEEHTRKFNRFAPPASYNPQPPPAPRALTGEEAYARRAAISQAQTGEEAYQRRLAMSQDHNAR